MVTKIFVSQIDNTNADGSIAPNGASITITNGAAVWAAANSVPTGYVGSIGFQGSLGASGYAGSLGEEGLLGPMGPEGYTGSVGAAGPGFQGSLGNSGYQGSAGGGVGYQGSIGNVGFQGSLAFGGYRGSLGYEGSIGFQGSKGDIGFVGSSGTAGFGATMPFTYLTDLSPNTYTNKANFVVRVNNVANGVTLVDGNTYLRSAGISSNLTFSSNSTIDQPVIKSYSETKQQLTSATNSITLTYSTGNIKVITLSPSSGSIVSIRMPTDIPADVHVTIVLYLKQDATGSRTVDWSLSNVKWPTAEGIPITGPTLSTTPAYTDILSFTTHNGGGVWYGFMSAKGFTV